jgi:hypothetical protein
MSITIDLKRWTYEGTAEAVAPLLPGTVLVAGWLIANPQLAYRLFVGELPVVLKIGAPLILAYTAGFVLMYVLKLFWAVCMASWKQLQKRAGLALRMIVPNFGHVLTISGGWQGLL